MKTEIQTTATVHHAILLFCTSASVLGYEILLMRLLSIGQWHHFAYMVISIALLGFGASGSLLFLLFPRIKKNLDNWLMVLSGATALSFSFAFSLSQKVGLDPLMLVWLPREWIKMLLTYLLMGSPFLLAGGIVGIILTGAGEKTHRMYAADLLGAGVGAIAIVPALFLAPPWALLPVLGGLVLLGAAWHCPVLKNKKAGVSAILISAGMIALSFTVMKPVPKIHQTKGLPMTLSLPDARIEATRTGPLGMIHVVGSDLIRHVPGLSLNFDLSGKEKDLPKQKALFMDADSLSPVTRFTGDLEALEHLNFTTMALPYFLRRPMRVLVAGAGGGMDMLLALKHEIPSITAIEANKQVADLLSGPFADFSGRLYSREEVKIEVREARQFIQTSKDRFDLIQISLVDAFGASSGGLQSASESYLYTTEAFVHSLSRLSNRGVFALTRWLKFPPRDSLRIIATALTALRRIGLSDHPGRHLLFIRSWKTSTILVSKAPFTPEEIARTLKFCEERSFDTAYYAGMRAEQANRFDILEVPDYFNGASRLSGPRAASFLKDYLFDIRPTSDDRPYFSHFFRWDKAPTLFRQLRKEWLPMVEIGFIFIIAALIQATLAGCLLILLPLFFRPSTRAGAGEEGHGRSPFSVLRILTYFGIIGLAFMFLEMALLPKFTLLLSHPVYAVAIVLSSILVFAGWGSLSVQYFQAKGSWFIWLPVAVILIWVGGQALGGDHLFGIALGWPFGWRVFFSVLLLALLSFFLGWPFPSGLSLLAENNPSLVPWAWGINGCASVIGAVLGKCLAISIGFRWLMFSACALYLLAALIYRISFQKVAQG